MIQKHYDYCQKTLELKDTLEQGFVALGERLKKIRDDRLYEGEWDDFQSYCEEMKMSEATASKIIGIYEKFIVLGGFSPAEVAKIGGWTTVAEALPFIKTKKDAEEILNEMANRNRQDLRIYLKERRTGLPQEKCNHSDTYQIEICRKCGQRKQVL